MNSQHVLCLEDITKIYGAQGVPVTALNSINLTISAGEFVAVMGPSGSGKSSLLALAGGLDSPSSGNVYVNGFQLNKMSQAHRARLRRRNVGYIFQSYNLIPTLTTAENAALPLELDGVSPHKALLQAKDALRQLDIGDLEHRFMDELSGGQQQRVAIARAMVGNKSLILADEPTGALDSLTGEEILTVLRRRADRGTAVVLVTHEPRYAAWADRVIYLRDGAIVDQTLGNSDPSILFATEQ